MPKSKKEKIAGLEKQKQQQREKERKRKERRRTSLPKSVKKIGASEILSHGDCSVAILLPDNTVLKLGQEAPTHYRPFDAPVLETGIFEPDFFSRRHYPQGIPFLRQPLVEICENEQDLAIFTRNLPSDYSFRPHCEGPWQLGRLDEKIVLVDYDSIAPF